MLRDALISAVANAVDPLRPGHPTRVGIDGVDGAGKTVFADELAAALRRHGRHVIRAGIDSFHNPRAVRYRRGRYSPDGYFYDSFDYGLVRRVLLDPLGPGGSRRYRTAAFDLRTDTVVQAAERLAAAAAILVFDGIFLHRPELSSAWDYSVFLRVGFDVSVPRCARRDATSPDPRTETNRRYIGGQRLYLDQCHPERRATIVVDNEVLAAPFVVDA
ncbi:MAG TPA: AAA family ATPase [Pseudonocardiaceae bacterium]